MRALALLALHGRKQRHAGQVRVGAFQRHARGNSLFRNRGDGTFEDITLTANIHHGGWAWGACFVDFDGDGWLDVLSPNGFVTGERADDL